MADDTGYSDTTEEIPSWMGGNTTPTGEWYSGLNETNSGTNPESMSGWTYKDGLWTDAAGKTYDLSSSTDFASKAANALKSLFTNKDGSLNLATIGGLFGGAAGLAGASSGPSKRVGYQGGIPKLQAYRDMVTAPPIKNYRPGQGGINWGGDAYYVPQGSIPAGYNPSGTADDKAAGRTTTLPGGVTTTPGGVDNKTVTPENVKKIVEGGGGGGGGGGGSGSVLKKIAGGGGLAALAALAASGGDLGKLKSMLSGYNTANAPVPVFNTQAEADAANAAQGLNDISMAAPVNPYNEDGTLKDDYQLDEENNPVFVSKGDTSTTFTPTTPTTTADTTADTTAVYDPNSDSYWPSAGATETAPIDIAGTYDPNSDSYWPSAGVTYDWGNSLSGINFDDFGGNTYLSDFDFGADTLNWAQGGAINMAKGRYLQGDTDGMADEIPAKIGQEQPAALSHGEFVVPADVVSHLGNGNSDAGAKKLYQMMDKIRMARTGTKKQGKEINPDKFMPGGLAQAYATGGAVKRFETGGSTGLTGIATAANAGITGQETAPSTWAGEYMSNLLGKTQALAESPYQQYMGPLTAGASDLQNKAFTGLQNVNFPSNLGQSFSSAGAYQPPQMNMDAYQTQPIGTGAGAAPTTMSQPQATAPQGIASQYMNPYLQSVLDPQMAELRRQSQINLLPGLAKLTQAGGFGGGRQAIMESEANRNLLQEQNKTLGAGYANAYDKAQQQFNTEQTQGRSLVDLLAQQGGTQRGIESEGIAADKKSFEEARQNPYDMLKFQQAMLQGMPISATSYDIAPVSKLVSAAQGATTVNSLLQNLGLIPKA